MRTNFPKLGPMPQAQKDAISRAKKGIPLSEEQRIRVRDQFKVINLERRGKPRSQVVRDKIRTTKTGVATSVGTVNGNWSGDSVQYPGIHQWLRKHFGAPQECQNKLCEGRGRVFDWAKKRGVEYMRRRENFLRLCRSCHRRYDKNESFLLDIRDLLTPRETFLKDESL